MGVKNYRDLIVWQKSVDLVINIYRLTEQFPKREIFGIVGQIRRCAISLSSNIAEGFGRRSNKEFIRFLNITMGSIFELQTQLFISYRLNFINKEIFDILHSDSREIEILLKNLINKLKSIENTFTKR